MTAAGWSYKGFRFPPEIISHCVWLYHRFPLSFRDVQERMLKRGVDVSRVRGLTKVAADFSLLAAVVNLARLGALGLRHAAGQG